MSRMLLIAMAVLAAGGTAATIKYNAAGSALPEAAVKERRTPALVKSAGSEFPPQDPPVDVRTPLDAIIYQRLGAAAASLQAGDRYRIGVGTKGYPVIRVPVPNDRGFHNFVVHGSAPARGGAQVISVTLEIKNLNGKTSNVTFKGDQIDALFWSTGALNKFVAPYYAAVLGTEHAFTILQGWKADSTIAAVCHTPTSLPCTDRATGVFTLDEIVDKGVRAELERAVSGRGGAQ